MEIAIQGFRLSPQQRHLWLLLDEGRDGAVQAVLSLEGALQPDLLEQAFHALTTRHEILRTAFRRAPGIKVPLQVVADSGSVDWRSVDLSEVAGERQAAGLAALADEERRRPFAVEQGVVLRGCLVLLAPSRARLVVTVPALCADPRSLGNLASDLAAAYEAATAGAVAAGEEPVQYIQVAEWQNQVLEEPEAAAARDWAEAMKADPVVLPYEGEPVAAGEGGLAAEPVPLPAAVGRLEAVAERYGTSAAAVLAAAWQVLLWRLTGQPQITFGALFDGRAYDELAATVGPLAKYLPVRCTVEGAATFGVILRRMDAAQGEALARLNHFAWSQNGDLGAGSRFDLLVDWEERPRPLAAAGVTFAVERSSFNPEPYKVKLACARTAAGELAAELRYDRRRLAPAAAFRLAGKLAALVAAALTDPESDPAELDLLTEEERSELAAELERTARETARELPAASLVELFAASVARAPGAVAVELEGRRLTYGELDQRSNQLANFLRAEGVGRGSLVGLCQERSLDMVVAILGVLKAGAAYVPLDPLYPKDRLAFTLADSRIELVLTETEFLELLPQQVRALCLDAERERIGRESAAAAAAGPAAGDLAYVIYTSGSTGRPKGVGVTHASVARLFAATAGELGFGPDDVWTLFHSYAFDFSVWESWGALLHGGRLIVVPYWVTRSPESFYELLAAEGVTVLNQTPSAFRQLIWAEGSVRERPEPLAPLALRLVIFGGEALDLAMLAPWFERHGDERPRLINMFGITETTVHVTWRPLAAADLEGPSVIGRAIPGWGVYLLGPDLDPVAAGMAGEICVGGGGVAVGYLGRAGLTAERFVPDSFATVPGARLYRSGDLGRRRAGGDLEYLGRIDHQVKVRGHRIELGEIEAALERHPAVREAVVVAREDDSGEQRLVAYVVSQGLEEISFAELRDFLQQLLPEPMIPTAAVQLDAIPLTPGGKLDRRALPAPGPIRPDLKVAYVAPRTDAEEVLAAIWAQVLGVEQVGIDDNFFALGGDSIRSVRAVALAKERGFHATVEELFEHQTIRSLAFVVRTIERETLPVVRTKPFSLVAESDRELLPDGLDDAYPLTHLQTGMLYHMELTPEAPAYHNVATWKVRAPFDEEVFFKAVDRVVARHPVLRTSFEVTRYERPLQLVHRQVRLPVSIHDLRPLDEAQQRQVLEEFWEREHRHLFDLAEPPYLRFHLHRRTDDAFQFTITENHAILDGWSLTSTIAEVFEVYLVLLGHKTPRVEPPLATSFRDYVHMEQATLESSECQEFWSRKLSGAQPTQLPRWPHRLRDQPDAQRGKLYVDVPGEKVAALRAVANSVAVPLKTVLFAVHLKMLSWATGRSDVLSGLVTNGRPEQLDGEQVRGLFLNTVPFRIAVADGTWVDLVRDTFEGEREMLPFRRYPLAALQQKWGRQRLFEAAFTFVHFHSVARLLGGQTVEILADDERDFSYNSFLLSVAFFLSPTKDQIRVTLEYDAVEFDRRQIAAIGDALSRIIDRLIAEPLRPHRADALLAESERRQVLHQGGGAAVETAVAGTLPELFAVQATRRPDATAVAGAGECVSYGELARRAGRVAGMLLSRGLEREQLVGLCLERSIDLVTGLLGILEAGGAYVPLDPSLPQERLGYLCADALGEGGLVVTDERFAGRFPGRTAVAVGAAAGAPAAEPAAVPRPSLDAACLAYVIYTSGSTGKPKGVTVSHANVVRLFAATAGDFGFGEGDVWTLFHSSAFDFSVWELWGPLLHGGRLVVVPYEVSRSPQDFHQLLAAERVTVLNQTPAAFGQLIAAEQIAAAADRLALRLVIFGGEALNLSSLAPWIAHHGDASPRLVNMYGITETTVHTTLYEVRRPDLEEAGRSPIGRPLADTRTYILDRALQPVPAGAVGEVFVGGPGLARGYLGRPGLTAERFIPDPLSGREGERFYRSGDLAAYRPDGQLEYLGRADNQVKVRGFRIELGEIEAALSGLREVREAAAVLRADGSGDATIVGYLVPERVTGLPPSSELRARLQRVLPDYMVPASFVTLEALPLTPNGKVDRNALPVPEITQRDLGAELTPPQTELQETIARIWREVLRVDAVGIHDSFFDLGGNSLRLFEVSTRLRESYQERRIHLLELMQYPTIAALTEHLSGDDEHLAAAEVDDRSAKLRQGREQLSEQFARLRRAPR